MKRMVRGIELQLTPSDPDTLAGRLQWDWATRLARTYQSVTGGKVSATLKRRLITGEGMGSFLSLSQRRRPDPETGKWGEWIVPYYGGQSGKPESADGLAQYRYVQALADMGLQQEPAPMNFTRDPDGTPNGHFHGIAINQDPNSFREFQPRFQEKGETRCSDPWSTHELLQYAFWSFSGRCWYVAFMKGPAEVQGPVHYRSETYAATDGWFWGTRRAGLYERMELPASYRAAADRYSVDELETAYNAASVIPDPEDAMNFISDGSGYVDPVDDEDDALPLDPENATRPAGDEVWGYRAVRDWHDDPDEMPDVDMDALDRVSPERLQEAFSRACSTESCKLRRQRVGQVQGLQQMLFRRAEESAPWIKPICRRILAQADLSAEKLIKAYLYKCCDGHDWRDPLTGRITRFPRPLTKAEGAALWYFWNRASAAIRRREARREYQHLRQRVKRGEQLTPAEARRYQELRAAVLKRFVASLPSARERD